ncbi:MAG: hypothetical protein EXS15_07430 [Phycisphaerales bacterium]|nr:hypothetical protein [Phycisphaerales bacterium]
MNKLTNHIGCRSRSAALMGIATIACQAAAQAPPASPPLPTPPSTAPTQNQPTIPAPRTQPGTTDGNEMAIAGSRMGWAEILEQDPSPTVVTDATLRTAISGTGLPWRVRDRITGIEMLLVPSGEFVMGMSRGDANANTDEKPAHDVILTRPFYLGRTEVTQAQWLKLMGSNQSYFQDINFQALPEADRDAKLAELMEAGYTRQQAEEKLGAEVMTTVVTMNWPVETLTFDDLAPFLQRANLRLPSEAEWEYACRAGSREPRYGSLDEIAWQSENSQERTHAVGEKQANALGFHDMIGNVWEWVHDWYGADYYRACENGATDPTGSAQNPFRVLRGGSWDQSDKNCRASFRMNHYTGDPRITDYGFRVARTP